MGNPLLYQEEHVQVMRHILARELVLPNAIPICTCLFGRAGNGQTQLSCDGRTDWSIPQLSDALFRKNSARVRSLQLWQTSG